MNRYEPSIPRVAFGIAAVVMTAITLGVSVILPAQMGSVSRVPAVIAVSKVATPASVGVVTDGSIDVVAVREPESSSVPCTASHPDRRPEG